MQYSDKIFWELPEETIQELKDTLTYTAFCHWAIARLSELIADSVAQKDWMEPDTYRLRSYRIKARDKHFSVKHK